MLDFRRRPTGGFVGAPSPEALRRAKPPPAAPAAAAVSAAARKFPLPPAVPLRDKDFAGNARLARRTWPVGLSGRPAAASSAASVSGMVQLRCRPRSPEPKRPRNAPPPPSSWSSSPGGRIRDCVREAALIELYPWKFDSRCGAHAPPRIVETLFSTFACRTSSSDSAWQPTRSLRLRTLAF